MNDQLVLDIDFKQKHSHSKFSLLKKRLYNFFYSTTYVPRSGKPFTINSIIVPISKYDLENVDVVDVVSVTLINPRLDERPFVMWVEKEDGQIIYYGIRDRVNQKWEPMDELNQADEETKNKLLLYSIKEMFSLFFATEMKLGWEYFLVNDSGENMNHYKIVRHHFYCNNFDRCIFKPKTVHSISKVTVDDKILEFDGDLRFVKDFYVYHSSFDTSTPALIETLDYEIGDELPLYNYYKPEFIGSTRWVGIECATNLKKPICGYDLVVIIDEITTEYINVPLKIFVKEDIPVGSKRMNVKFNNVPFYLKHYSLGYFDCYDYIPVVNYSFFIDMILYQDVELKIDIRSREINRISVFNIEENKFKPILFCFGLHRTPNDLKSKLMWYRLESLDGNSWIKLDFNISPKNFQEVEKKIRELYEPYRAVSRFLPSLLPIILTLGILSVMIIVMNCSVRVLRGGLRLYRFFRVQVV